MKDNKGFATSFLLFSILILFLIMISVILFTLSNSSSLNGKIKSKLESDIQDPNEYSEYNFYYTGDVQMFIAPKDRNYVIKAWSASNNYATGNIFLKKGEKLFIYVGKSGYNGGDSDIREKYGSPDDATSQSSTILKAGYNSSDSSVSSQKFNKIEIKNSSNLGQDTNPSKISGNGHVRIYYNSITAANIGIDPDANDISQSLKDDLINLGCDNVQCILDEVSHMIKGEETITKYEFGTYIQSTGTQYIDTGIKPDDSGGKIQAKFSVQEIPESSQDYVYIYGVEKNASPSNSLDIRIKCSTNKLEPNAYSSTQTNLVTASLNTDYTTELIWNRTSSNSNYQSFNVNGSLNEISNINNYKIEQSNMYIFAGNINGPTKHTKMKLYYFKMYNSNGIMIRDYVPAKKISDGTVGLYDKVEKRFYTNSGSGTFNYVK